MRNCLIYGLRNENESSGGDECETILYTKSFTVTVLECIGMEFLIYVQLIEIWVVFKTLIKNFDGP